MANTIPKDPVDKSREVEEEKEILEGIKGIDVNALKLQDFKSIGIEQRQLADPFDGYDYPLGEVEDADGNKHQATFIIMYMGYTPNDPSNDAGVRSTHSMAYRNWRTGNREGIIFDRTIKLADGDAYPCAIVPEHNLRAQCLFSMEPQTGQIVPNGNYRLLDTAQRQYLYRIFRNGTRRSRDQEALVKFIEET